MPSVSRRPIVTAGVIALTLGAAAACGSSSSGGSPGGSTVSPATSAGTNAAAVAEVPAAIKSKGTLVVAADASYAPDEFLAADGTTVQGMDADLAQALGRELGLKVTVKNVTFDAIIPGLVDGRYDLGMSSFTDTKAREQQVNFVDYFSAGTSFFEKSAGGPAVTGLDSLCGLKVSVESGTTEEQDANKQSKTCTSAGKAAVDVESFSTQNEANLALSSGRADVSMADSPVAAYQVKQSNGAFKLVGTSYGTAPYGIAVPKSDGTLDVAVKDALEALIADGSYGQILSKWGLTSGGITNPGLNGAIS
ncbi:MAG TPA: ABC transporter substrate-binding protein [Mycobacteriales bacterium]|nr:ABC transporter substrate-binding protein [Mycobacteriales bacterium]HWA65705.1 ABC transporter substrate-binding protein [Mycobacteriales bacterium]